MKSEEKQQKNTKSQPSEKQHSEHMIHPEAKPPFKKAELYDQFKILLNGSDKFHLQEEFQETISCQIKDCDLQYLKVTLRYAFLSLSIDIIFLDGDEKELLKSLLKINGGGFSKIYQGQLNLLKYIFKAVEVRSQNWVHIFQEYFLAMLASQLKVGPKMQYQKVFHCDIIIAQDTAYFIMELCQDPDQLSLQEKTVSKNKLLQKLAKIHKLHFIHGDIKPDNISYSMSLGSYVFLDFGLSRILIQDKNQKTRTSFFGTYTYAIKEFRSLGLLRQRGDINLYDNDFHCLQKTLKQYKQNSQSYQLSKDQQEEQLKYLIKGNRDLSKLVKFILNKKEGNKDQLNRVSFTLLNYLTRKFENQDLEKYLFQKKQNADKLLKSLHTSSEMPTYLIYRLQKVLKLYINYTQERWIYSQSMRNTLIYLYPRISNSNMWMLLRMMFICIEDWDYVLKTENKAIECIESPFMKLLKSTEFLLFRLALNQGFQDESDYTGLIDMCQKIEPTEDYQRKLISFIKQIASARRMYDCEFEWKTERISQLEIARKHFQALEQQEAIHHILHTFIDLCGHQPHDFEVDAPGCVGLKLYSRHFIAVESQLRQWKDYQECKVTRFAPVEVEFVWMFQNPTSKGRDEFISTWSSILKKQPLKVFVARLLKIKAASSQEVPYIILQLGKIALKNQSPKEIWETILTVNGCLDFVIANEKWAQKEERITEEQKVNITRELSRILSLLDKASPKLDYLNLYLMIVQFKFDLLFGEKNELETQLATIVAVFESKLQHPSCLFLLFSAYELMRRKKHSDKITFLVRAAQSYESKRPYVFSRLQQFSRKFAESTKMKEGQGGWQQVDKLVKDLLENCSLQRLQPPQPTNTKKSDQDQKPPLKEKMNCEIQVSYQPLE